MADDRAQIPEWAVAERELIRQMNSWTAEVMAREAKVPWLEHTDQCTFMMSWVPHYFLTGDERLKSFMYEMRDRRYAWAPRSLLHGYYAEWAEEHHHTEDYKRFLTRLWYLDPYDPLNIRCVEDFAHHLGNWVEGIPAWYDWKRHCFVSRYLGTRSVSESPEHRYNNPQFFRYLLVLTQAYLMTGETRYLDLCLDYADRWCDLLESLPGNAPLPQKVDLEWNVVESRDDAFNWIMGGFVSAMLDLFLLVRNERYVRAARMILDRMLTPDILSRDPYGLGSATLAAYRIASGDCAFDSRILEAVAAIPAAGLPDQLLGQGVWPSQRMGWVDSQRGGERAKGGASGAYTGPGSPYCLAYQITGGMEHATRALRFAVRQLELARSIGSEGRTHGCDSGHGNHTVLSDTMPVLYPLTLGLLGVAARGTGHHKPLVTYRGPDGSFGLPENVAALFNFRQSAPHRPNVYTLSLVSLAAEPVVVRVIAHDGLMRRRICGASWAIARQAEFRYEVPTHPWEEIASASVMLPPGATVDLAIPVQLDGN